MMKLISWNVAGRKGKQSHQLEVLLDQKPDIVALQEVTRVTGPLWRKALEQQGFQVADSSALLDDRKYFCLVAAKWAVAASDSLGGDYPERVLSARIKTGAGPLEIHNAHIVPGSSRGLKKIEMFEAIYKRLAQSCAHHRILCGDFNTPQAESTAGVVTTWADRYPDVFDRWNKGELGVLTGLGEFDLPDIFRKLNGYKAKDVTWVWKGKAEHVGRRFDHVFASTRLNARSCRYHHAWREDGLSDHSAIEAVFDPAQ